MYRLYAKSVSFYIQELNISGFFISVRGPGINATKILRDNCIILYFIFYLFGGKEENCIIN